MISMNYLPLQGILVFKNCISSALRQHDKGRSSLMILKEAYMIIKFIPWQASAERDFYYDFYYNDVTKALDFQEHNIIRAMTISSPITL